MDFTSTSPDGQEPTFAPDDVISEGAADPIGDLDRTLIENGYEPIAVSGKKPAGMGWTTGEITAERIAAERRNFPHATSTGLRTGRVVGVDVDILDREHVERIKELASEVLGPTTMERFGSKGAMLCYRNETPISKITIDMPTGSSLQHRRLIEILGAGQQFVAYGDHPDTKKPYVWPGVGEPHFWPYAELPETNPDKLREFADRAAVLLHEMGYIGAAVSGGSAKRTRREAPEGIELDLPLNIQRAEDRLRDRVKRGLVAGPGNRDDMTYQVACEVLEFGLTAETAAELMTEIWVPHCEEIYDGVVEEKVRNALNSMQNAPGSRAYPNFDPYLAGVTFNPAPDKDANAEEQRIKAKFMSLDNTDAAPSEPRIVRNIIEAPTRATPMRELVPGWIEAGHTVMVSGRGGSHKSRLIMQLCFSLLCDRDLFDQRGAGRHGVYRLGKGGRRGGVDVGHIEVLSYEDDDAEIDRRLEKMKAAFRVAPKPGEADPTDRMAIWGMNSSRLPVLVAEENGAVTLTPFGCRMLRRWEKLAEDGRHVLLWFDSLFNAVQFARNSKNIDICAQRVIGILNHWCKVLNCTIMAPFHPSRAGDNRGDTGYSAAFQDTVRQVLSIGEIVRRVPNGRPTDFEGTGEYQLRIMKWNGGPQSKKLIFQYSPESGQLVTQDDISECGAMPLTQAAVSIIEEFTYKNDKEALARLRSFGLTDDERGKIEHGFAFRIRDEGAVWKVGGFVLTRDHHVIGRFREITGNDRATDKDLLSALADAERAGLLGYAKSDQAAKSDKRRRAGYCISVRQVGVVDEGGEVEF